MALSIPADRLPANIQFINTDSEFKIFYQIDEYFQMVTIKKIIKLFDINQYLVSALAFTMLPVNLIFSMSIGMVAPSGKN